jgi:YVTN family beta-propeller protein
MNHVSRSGPRGLAAVALWAIAFAAMANAEPKSSNALPTSSSPIAITSDDRFVWVVNPDNNSVSVIAVFRDENRKVAEILVGEEPRFLAITPKDHRVFVSNSRDGTVSMISSPARRVLQTTAVGTEPAGLAATPDGKFVYVANFGSDDVAVLDAQTGRFIQSISGVGPKPRGIAIVGDKVYVTHFLAELRNDARTVAEKQGRDDGKDGRVTVISRTSNQVVGTVVLNPLADAGFRSNGSVLDRIPAADPATFTFVTGCFPNLLESIVIKGTHAYLPNVGASPNGPVRFNVNVQALLSVFDTGTDTDSGQTINMNQGVQFEPVGKRVFNTTPIALAFKQGADEGYAVAAGINRLVRVALNGAGKPTINAPANAADPGGIVRIEVGKNPQGIVINSTDTRAYVFNYISRDVSVVDIATGSSTVNTELARVPAADLPAAGTLAAIVHHGKELFNTSIGPAGTQDNALPPAGRMSDFGWGNCYNCHPRGLSDGVTWMFGDGPRQTISMESTAEHPQPDSALINANGAPLLPSFKQRVLNWSAVRDEVQDFELNIRGVSGGQGLIRDGNAVVNLTPTANTGRDADLDAITAYIAFGIKAPISPLRGADVSQGRALFAAANCQSCHGGVNWTRSAVDFTPPPLATETITGGQLVRFLRNVGTFDPNVFNEVRPNVVTANGAAGFNVPSLLSVIAGAPYLHSGSALTLDDVLNNVTHRSAGTGGVDTLSNSVDRQALVGFLESIDEQTTPFP